MGRETPAEAVDGRKALRRRPLATCIQQTSGELMSSNTSALHLSPHGIRSRRLKHASTHLQMGIVADKNKRLRAILIL